jgi:hypothetical protein
MCQNCQVIFKKQIKKIKEKRKKEEEEFSFLFKKKQKIMKTIFV